MTQFEITTMTKQSGNPNLITDIEIARLMGYSENMLGMARNKLEDEGVKVFPGKGGRWFVTLQQLNAARGIMPGDNSEQHEELF